MTDIKHHPYTLYCLYHNQVFPQYYGDQIDRITFVKMDQGEYVFPAKNHISLAHEPYFHPIGKEWVEYEFYYSLYKGYKKGIIELPEYMGFIQYDMEFHSTVQGQKISVIEYLDDMLEKKNMQRDIVIGFFSCWFHTLRFGHASSTILSPDQPHMTIGHYMENIVSECAQMTGMNISLSDFQGQKLFLAGAVFLHRDIFIICMEHLAFLIESKKLDMYDRNHRVQGCLAERYLAVLLFVYASEKRAFSLPHHHMTLLQKTYKQKIYRFIGKIYKKLIK